MDEQQAEIAESRALTTTAAGGPGVPAKSERTWTGEELDRLIARAQQNDRQAMGELALALRQHPDQAAALERVSVHVEGLLLRATAPDNLLLRELWPRRLAELRAELAGKDPTPLERLLVERIVTCYLAVNLAEIDAVAKGGSLERREFYERRLERAHHRYESAVVALARVRRLLGPVVQQVNIAHAGAQQLNVAGPGPALLGERVGDEAPS